MEDFAFWASILSPIICGVIAYFVKDMRSDISKNESRVGRAFNKIEAVEKELGEHILYAEKSFAQKSDVEKAGNRIYRYMERLEDKIDGRIARPKPEPFNVDEE